MRTNRPSAEPKKQSWPLKGLAWVFRLCCATASVRFAYGTASVIFYVLLALLAPQTSSAQIPAASNVFAGAVVIELEGTADFMAQGLPPWRQLVVNFGLQPGDRVRVNGRLVLRLADRSTLRFDQGAEFEIDSPPPKAKTGINLLRGLMYLFHRDEPTSIGVRHRTVSAAIRGTEFVFEATDDGPTILTVIDGQVQMSGGAGEPIDLNSGEQGMAEAGKRAVKTTAAINTVNVLQWCLYYPAILDLDELSLTADTKRTLAESLLAYRQGDLLQALSKYPPGRKPEVMAEQVYLAALRLAVGQVDPVAISLDKVNADDEADARFVRALRHLISAVKQQADSPTPDRPFSTASEWLAESYYQQSIFKLPEALAAARKAAEKSPSFGFAWARVAEMEFSFGRTAPAKAAITKALRLAPRNPEALVLDGFIKAAENRIPSAIESFNRAIEIDGALGNAWLGRGLCKIRRGEVEAGRDDIQIAVTLEPQRAVLRSYLGKAWSELGDLSRAGQEIQLAKQFDAKDPTGWLYSALLRHQQNRINEAIEDLETSRNLTENRRLYRSRLLLDQDRAVRSANLAALYQDAGMFDPAVREASKAVTADYANPSAHSFLAYSYAQISDPQQTNLRFETPRTSEYLLANMLAPVGGGILSATISQQEYSPLFERDRFGLASVTEYLSRGSWFQSGVLFGQAERLSYSLEYDYRSENGQRANNDLEQTVISAQTKIQLAPNDDLYFQAIAAKTDSGDTAPRYDPANAGAQRVQEDLEPLLLAGYHHQWSPGSHTLALFGYARDTLTLTNPAQGVIVVVPIPQSNTANVTTGTLSSQEYESAPRIWNAEAQQVFQTEKNALILGTRFQGGSFETGNRNAQDDLYFNPPQRISPDFARITVYGYDYWHLAEPLLLVAGLSYDWLQFPVNFRSPPLREGESSTDQVSPKLGLIWTPSRGTMIRAAYTRSLGGVSFDQSFRLEPTLVGGFNQAYRSIVPEAIAGANSSERFTTYDLGVSQDFPTRSYFGLTVELLKSEIDRLNGAFAFSFSPTNLYFPSSLTEHLDYEERTLYAAFHQLLGKEWTVGTQYRVSRAELRRSLPNVPQAGPQEATLHQLFLQGGFNHPLGFFGQAQALWHLQDNGGGPASLSGDEFWQFNLYAGYRFPRRRAELRLGLLNITDQDYRLNPLNLTAELPRTRTLAVSFKFNF